MFKIISKEKSIKIWEKAEHYFTNIYNKRIYRILENHKKELIEIAEQERREAQNKIEAIEESNRVLMVENKRLRNEYKNFIDLKIRMEIEKERLDRAIKSIEKNSMTVLQEFRNISQEIGIVSHKFDKRHKNLVEIRR